MRIKVESVERAPRPEEYWVHCDDCSARGKTHPVDIVTFDVVMGCGHYNRRAALGLALLSLLEHAS